MRTHTNNFKTNMKNLGRQYNVRVAYGNTTLQNEQINSATLNYNGDILRSVMKTLELDSNIDIPLNTQITFQFGILVGNGYEYINYGTFIVNKSEKQENTNSYLLTCYDKMLYSMIPYESLGVIYPITIRNYISAICTKLGLQFQNTSDNFVNYNKEIPNELYLGSDGNSLDYTFRDVLDELAQVTASTICINDSGKLEVRYITNTNDTIDEEFLKNVNVNFGEQYGAINTITFSRSADSDNISKSIPTNLPDADKIEIKISDNQILNGNNRDEFIDGILNKLYGLSYYINDFASTGITYYDLCDRYNVKVGNTTYSCVMLNDEININSGVVENIHTDMPKTSKTDYTKTDKTDRKISQTYLIVDKQQGQINAVVSQVDEIEQDLSSPTNTLTGQYFDIDNALDEPLVDFSMEGQTEQDGTPTPDTPQDIHCVSGDNTIKIQNRNIWIPTLTNNGSNISSTRCTVTLNNDEYTLTATGNDIQFGQISPAGNNYTNSLGTLYKVENTTSIGILLTNTLFVRNYITFYNSNKVSLGYTRIDNNSGKVNVPNEATYFSWRIGILNSTSGTQYKTKVMVSYNETPSTYIEPQEQSQLISLPVENLFDISTSQSYKWLTYQGVIQDSQDPNIVSNFIKVENGKQYIFSGIPTGTYTIRVCSYTGTTTNTFKTLLVNNDSSIRAFTADADYIVFAIGQADATTLTSIQLEKGTKANSYTPYGTTPIELLKIGNYKDYIHRQDNRWYLHEETGKVVLNGSESGWVYEYNEGYIRCYKNIVNGNTISSRTTFISNRFRFASSGLDVGAGFIFASKIYLFVPRNLTSLADFKVWLSNNNVTLCYPLAEPTDTEITGTLLEQLNRLMTLPLYKNMTHITIEPNDLTPIMNIEYVKDTAINSQFVRQPQLNNYYTRTETTAQINISNSSIKSDVAEIQTTLDNNGNTISSLSRQVQTLQSTTSLQINAINKTLEDGVEKLTNSLVTIDINGINTSKDNETFNTQITNKTFEVKDGDNRMGFMGFDTDKQKMLVEFPEMQTQKLTNAYHTTEKITEDGLKWSADFYVGDDN